jgi:hypothetical protein
MKYILAIVFLMVTSSLLAQSSGTSPKTVLGAHISFTSTIHDFGVIPYMGDASFVYVFTNTGSEPLTITNCIKGCGCTSVDWTKDPIKPGGKGLIKAVYDSKKIGDFNRGVDVYSNDVTNPKVNIRLKGTVVKINNDTTTNKLAN